LTRCWSGTCLYDENRLETGDWREKNKAGWRLKAGGWRLERKLRWREDGGGR